MSSTPLFEICLGILSTADDAERIREACVRSLAELGVAYELALIDPVDPVDPVAPEEPSGAEELSLTERYEELPEQWRAQYGEPVPADREVRELRVRLRVPAVELDGVKERLTRLICPDPEHRSPCPVPWSVGYSGEPERATDEL